MFLFSVKQFSDVQDLWNDFWIIWKLFKIKTSQPILESAATNACWAGEADKCSAVVQDTPAASGSCQLWSVLRPLGTFCQSKAGLKEENIPKKTSVLTDWDLPALRPPFLNPSGFRGGPPRPWSLAGCSTLYTFTRSLDISSSGLKCVYLHLYKCVFLWSRREIPS